MRCQRYWCTLVTLALSLGGGAIVRAQGAVRVTRALVQVEIPIGRSTRALWRWNDEATPDGRAEYVWSVQLDGDSTHSIGFMLFKFRGAAPREGTFEELLRAGQANVAVVIGHREQALRGVRPTLRGEDSTLVVELRDSTLIAKMFAMRPQQFTLTVQSPYVEASRRRVPVSYDRY